MKQQTSTKKVKTKKAKSKTKAKSVKSTSQSKISGQKEFILTIGAHNDDYLLGAGGTLYKYTREGKTFSSVIFSYGENSHPHLKEKVVVHSRVKESQDADKILGGEGVIYLGQKEGDFLLEENQKKSKEFLKKLILDRKPTKIFTHAIQDPHPDHQAVMKTVLEVVEEMNYKGDVYSFDIWNMFNFRRSENLQMIVDVSETFSKKMEAFKAHKSQTNTMVVLGWNIYFKAILNGFKHGYKFCEVFEKLW